MKASSLVIETFVVFIIVTCSAYPVITNCHIDVQSCSKATNPPRPILIVPGVGGSMLYSKSTGRKAWVGIDILNGAEETAIYLWGQFNKSTSLLENQFGIYAPLDGSGLCAMDNLNPDVFITRDAYYMHQFISSLTCHGYELSSSIRGFPYDWRQSIRSTSLLDQLHETVQSYASSHPSGVIDVVSHSMGGLVMKAYLGKYPEDMKLIKNWVAVAPPFEGGGGYALQAFIDGYNFGKSIIISQRLAHQMVMQMPSVYELLPAFGSTNSPTVSYTTSTQHTVSNTQLQDFLHQVNDNNYFLSDRFGNNYPNGFSGDLWNYAQDTRVVLQQAEDSIREFTCWHNDQNSFKMYVVMGHAVDTPYSLTYPDGVDNLNNLQNQHPIFSHVNGDGTVPFTSAQADTNSIKYIYKGSSNHMDMMSNSDVIAAIIGLIQNSDDIIKSQSMVEFHSDPTHNCVKTLPALLIIGGGCLIIISVPVVIIVVRIVRRRRARYMAIQ